MKVVHISTSMYGGAAIAGLRIHKALLKAGIDSIFICLDKENNYSINTSTLIQEKKSLLNLILEKMVWRLKTHFKIAVNRKESYYLKLNKFKNLIDAEMVSLPFSDLNIMQDERIKNADIVHLHWVSGILDYPSFFKEYNKIIVWTLHDLNPIKGLFHYENDEKKHLFILNDINSKVSKFKKKIISSSKAIICFVAPSNWLFSLISAEIINKHISIKYIPYSIDCTQFFYENNLEIYKKFDIPEGNTVLLFIAENINNYRKGFDILLNALLLLSEKSITLIAIGDAPKNSRNDLDIRYIGKVTDYNEMRKYYSLADFFLLPSREDNLPNVMLESLSCGTPVISFNVGGMKDVIVNGFNGELVNNIEEIEYAKAIDKNIKLKSGYDRSAIINHASKIFSEEKVAKQYVDIYKNIKATN